MRKDRKDLTIELLEVLSWFEAETEPLHLRRRQLIDRTMMKEGFVEEKKLESIYFDKEMLNLFLDMSE